MANGKITLGKQSGGTLALVFPDGADNTEVVLPESGELVTKDYADTRDAQNVKLTGNQTIYGVKTFSSSPIVPTPTMGTQAVTKAYADLKVALADFTGGNQSLISNGYQKLPGGLILQWATVVESASETDYNTFPIAFPTTCLMVNIQLNSATLYGLGLNVGTVIHLIDRTKFIWTAAGSFGGGGVAYMFAIGY